MAPLMQSLTDTFRGLRYAWACPFCGSETSDQVRVKIFGNDFWVNAASVLGPAPVLLVITAGLWWVSSRER
jgi:hypothetical protein